MENPNFIVPTPPAGDSSNRVADTAFVTGAVSNAFIGQLIDVQFVMPGGGALLTAGNKGWLHIPITATISAWRVMGDQTGTVTVDILRTHNGFPTASMVGTGTKPVLAAQQFAQAVPSGWTSTALVPDDWVAFVATGTISSVTQVTVCLTCTR